MSSLCKVIFLSAYLMIAYDKNMFQEKKQNLGKYYVQNVIICEPIWREAKPKFC